MSNPINTYPITSLIQQIKAADIGQQKEVRIDIKSAKLLSYALGEILSKVNQDYEVLLKNLQKSTGDTVTVQLDGGGFSNQQQINIYVVYGELMSRPKPRILLEYVNKKNYKCEQILDADAIWAVFYKEKPFNLKSFNSLVNYPGPKYKKVSFSNPGHAIN